MRPRIGIARIWQETNSFSQRDSRLEDFKQSDWLDGAALLASLAGRQDELAGFADALHEADIVPLITACSWPGGPAEPELVNAILDRLQRAVNMAGTLDGVLISLHGAMASPEEPDVEGAVLRLLRNMLGSGIPIVATMDHHGNLTARIVDAADAVTAYRECPHVDMRETGRRGARLLLDMIAGELAPEMAFCKLPLVTPCEGFATDTAPMADWFSLARQLEAEKGIRDISLFPVQPWLDIPEFGWSVLVVADKGQGAKGRRIAAQLAQHAWTHRAAFTIDKWTPADAVAYAASSPRGPIVLADGADATNGGSPGDSPHLLQEMLKQGIKVPAYLTLVDAPAVAAAHQAGEGSRLTVNLGATMSTRFHRPVGVNAVVSRLNHGRFAVEGHLSAKVDMGRMAVLAVGAIKIVVSERAGPGHDPAVFRHMGLDPASAQIVVVKSTVGHLRSYGPFMAENLPVECPGPSPSRLERLAYRLPQRPLYPLDPNMEWTAK